MPERLKWEKLLSTERQRNGSGGNSTRNEFEADYDRIVGSSSVRRLQDKAQVFPLQENDFTRTRLTHSMEVAAMAYSLGKAVGKSLEAGIPGMEAGEIFDREKTEELAAMLRTAGLIHDLGNPPFGHYGENVIRDWFCKWFEKTEVDIVALTEQQRNDFCYFDGNVQNLRIVTKLQTLNDALGANFTFGTLSTIMKYPWKSDSETLKNIKDEKKKKFGYFASEEKLVEKIREATGLAENVRHPATYLLEAADDIIYFCDDIEDGAKKGYINWEKEYAQLKVQTRQQYRELFETIEKKEPDKNMEESEKMTARVRNFRNFTQSYLFEKAKAAFLENYSEIMTGQFKGELLDGEETLIEALKTITAKNCFACLEVMELELVGDKVIRTLLDEFVSAIFSRDLKDGQDVRTKAGKLYSLISPNFKYIACHDYEKEKQNPLSEVSTYDKIHLIIDYVSGMTDSYAVNLYKSLSGIRLPERR